MLSVFIVVESSLRRTDGGITKAGRFILDDPCFHLLHSIFVEAQTNTPPKMIAAVLRADMGFSSIRRTIVVRAQGEKRVKMRNAWFIVTAVVFIIVITWFVSPRTAQTPTALPPPATSTAPARGAGTPPAPAPAPQQQP